MSNSSVQANANRHRISSINMLQKDSHPKSPRPGYALYDNHAYPTAASSVMRMQVLTLALDMFSQKNRSSRQDATRISYVLNESHSPRMYYDNYCPDSTSGQTHDSDSVEISQLASPINLNTSLSEPKKRGRSQKPPAISSKQPARVSDKRSSVSSNSTTSSRNKQPTPKALTERARRMDNSSLVKAMQDRLDAEGGFDEKQLSVANKRKSHGLKYNKIPTIKEFIYRYDLLKSECEVLEAECRELKREMAMLTG
jgi:hypothetical protein